MTRFWLGRWFPIVLLIATFMPAPLSAQEPAKPAATLAPALEAKLAEFLKQARAAKRRLWETQTRKQIEDITKATKLDPGQIKALEQAAEKAMELSLEDWVKKAGEGWRTWAQQMENQPPELFDQVLAQVDQTVQTDWFGDYVRPFEQPKWEEGLRGVLTPAQAATWEKTEQERRQAVQKDIAGSFKTIVERTRERLRTALMKKSAAIWSALQLPKERALKFNALAESIAEGSAAKWRERAERMLLSMEENQRQQMLKGGNFYVRPDEQEAQARETAWEEGVAKLLSPEEAKRLRATQAEYKERRTAALAQILIAQLDEQVAFTASQRRRLRRLAERQVKGDPALLPDASHENYYQIDLQRLLACGRNAGDGELIAILDPIQRKRWEEACSGRNPIARSNFAMPRQLAPAAKASAPARPGEPEDLENAISDHLHEKTAAEQKRLLSINLLKAEDAARVAGLSASAALQLATAARGATEEELAAWKTTTDQSIRSQLRDVTLENVKQRLAGMDRYTGRRSSGNSDFGALWEETVKTELTEAQRTAWKKELEARGAYRDRAITALVMAELDRRIALTTDQWSKLESLIAVAVKDYGPDIGSMFSFSYWNIWYLQSHSMFVPVAAVPEQELKTIFTKAQMEQWTGGEEFGNTSNYWENVQRIHSSRVKEKKE